MANGGDWGGVKVDQAFDKFLLDIVGMETMDICFMSPSSLISCTVMSTVPPEKSV
jgi:hypothetical protein